jgi:hypothetical protein
VSAFASDVASLGQHGGWREERKQKSETEFSPSSLLASQTMRGKEGKFYGKNKSKADSGKMNGHRKGT